MLQNVPFCTNGDKDFHFSRHHEVGPEASGRSQVNMRKFKEWEALIS